MVDRILTASAPRAALFFAASLATLAWLHGASTDGGNTRAVAATSSPSPDAAGFADLVDKVKPAVVGVRAKVRAAAAEKDGDLSIPQGDSERLPWPFGNAPRSTMHQGTGFFVSSDGYAVTTNHVVEGSERIEVTTDDDKTYSAKVVGSDSQTDLALLKVDADRTFSSVQFAQGAPRIGEWVLAVGNPFGLGGTVTAGIVSARAREIESGGAGEFIQIDAPINQGNSGGPTFNLNGAVIGVNSAIFSPSGGSVGIGFAIPAETAKAVIPQLKDKGAVIRGWLGIQIQNLSPEIAEGLGYKDRKGALVVEPQAGSPAQKAGLATGDIIVSLNAHPISDVRELRSKVSGTAPGTTVQLELRRNGEAKTVSVTLGEMPRANATIPKETPSGPEAGDTRTPGTAPSDLGFVLAPGDKHDIGQGVLVTRVDPDGIAAERGFDVGDVILDVGGTTVRTPSDVQKALSDTREHGKHVAIARVKTGESVRFVAIPVG
jgi:serine protease Do